MEWPCRCLRTDGGSETVHTVKVPSDAPYASRSELMCPNFKTVTVHKNKWGFFLFKCYIRSQLSNTTRGVNWSSTWRKKLPEALHWSKMQCIPTNEYAGSARRLCGRSLSLLLEPKLLRGEGWLPLWTSCKEKNNMNPWSQPKREKNS